MRHLLPDDSLSDGKAISYPTSMEAFGRGIDLVQTGTFNFFCVIDIRQQGVHLNTSGFCVILTTILCHKSGQKHSFSFDKVFVPDASQERNFTTCT